MANATVPPSTFEEILKRTFVPPKWELARITAREWRRGEPELHLLIDLVDPNRAAFDIGANRGIWSNVMSRYSPSVWAFEPNPKMFAILSRAVPANVMCRAIALSDQSGSVEFLIPGRGRFFSNQGGTLSPRKVGNKPSMRIPVACARLDDLDTPPVGFIKIDVEGHEQAVLKGARKTILRDRPVMIIEIEERHTGERIEAALDCVEQLGYRTHVLKAGRLTGRDAFDPQADHRDMVGKAGYINNFVFLPD